MSPVQHGRPWFAALVLCLVLTSSSSAAPILVGEEDSLSAPPVFAGSSVAWVGNYGYCIPDPQRADPRVCVQYLARWRRGTKRTPALFDPPAFDPAQRFGVAPVVALAGTPRMVAYGRLSELEDDRDPILHGQEYGAVPNGRPPLPLVACRGERCRCYFTEIAASERAVATPLDARGRSGVVVHDLARRRKHAFRRARCVVPALAGRYLAVAEGRGVSVYDWRRERLVKRVRTPRNHYLSEYDVQSDGTLAIWFVRIAGERGRLVVVSRRRRRPLFTRSTNGFVLRIARNRVAYESGGLRPTITVRTVRGRVVSRFRPAPSAPGAHAVLADFDGRCLLWTDTRFDGLERSRIFTQPVGAPAGPCGAG